MKKPLSPLQRRVYDALAAKPNTDVHIGDMYDAGYPRQDIHHFMSNRDKQQQLGPVVKRINEKLEPGRVIPGKTKQTYRLQLNG